MPQIYDMEPTASAGFEPANLSTKCQHATPRPPKPHPPHYHNINGSDEASKAEYTQIKKSNFIQVLYFSIDNAFVKNEHARYTLGMKKGKNLERLITATSQARFLGITPVSLVSNGLYFLTLPLVSVMRVIYRKTRHARYLYIKRNVEKVWGACYTLGACYLSKNTVIRKRNEKKDSDHTQHLHTALTSTTHII